MSERKLTEPHPGPDEDPEDAAPKQHDKPTYDAFLSYSHAADDRLAPAVQRGLHQLAKPWYRMRALRVFRDQLSLSANPDLWATITAALESSRYFILMASPKAAASPWVQREVEYWKSYREPGTFLIVLTEGRIVWDHTTGDFDWTHTTALPPQLRGWFDADPLWVQLGWARGDNQLSLRYSQFRDSIATLAAPIWGVAKDDLDSEDVRQHRLTTRVRNGGIAILTLLTVVSLVLGIVATQEAHQAQVALQRAVSRELSTRSQALGDIDPVVSKLLSVAAWRLDPTADARAAMIAAFNRPGIAVFPDGGGPVAVSPDRRILATGNATTVRLWDAVSHKPIGAPLTGHTGFIGTVKFSPNGNMLATGSADGTVRLWDTASHQQIGDPLTRDNEVVRAVTFSRDGGMLAIGSDNGTVRLWDTASHRPIGEPFHGYDTGSVAISPDNHTVAFFGKDSTVRLWDIPSHTQIGAPLTGFTGSVIAVAFSPNGSTLATGGYDGAVRLWDVASHSQIGDALTGFKGSLASFGVNFVAFSTDGATVTASGSDGTVRSWDVSSHTQIGDALSGGVSIHGAAVSSDGDTLAVSNDNGTVRLWDLTSRNERGTPLINGGGSSSAAFSPDGRTLAVGDTNGTVRLWNTASHAESGAPLTDPTSAAITAMVFSPDGHTLAVGGHSSKVRLWDVATHTPIGDALTNWAEPIAFNPDGRTLITNDASSSKGLRVWNVMTHMPIADLQPDRSDGSDHFASMAMSRDGLILATGSYDGKVRFWDINTRQQLGDPLTGPTESVSAMAFRPDRRTLITGGPHGTVRLWDVNTRRQIGDPLTGFTGDRVMSVAFSPDGAVFAAAGEDGSGRFWDASSRIPIGTPLTHYGETIESIAFSPDSHTLATSTLGTSNAVRLWKVPSLARIDSVLCAQVRRSLAPDEWQRYIPELPYRQICP